MEIRICKIVTACVIKKCGLNRFHRDRRRGIVALEGGGVLHTYNFDISKNKILISPTSINEKGVFNPLNQFTVDRYPTLIYRKGLYNPTLIFTVGTY